jgi:hypothetical protein
MTRGALAALQTRVLPKVNPNIGRFTSFNTCPAEGPITYFSDFVNGVINIYAGPLMGQKKCGQIAGLNSGLVAPQGMFVKMPGHKLYVADRGGNILEFDRGTSRPSNTYTDPTPAFPADVTVASDGTVIASNAYTGDGAPGSISTWKFGPNGGQFVGNFPMTNDFEGLFVTVQKNGTVYYDDIDAGSGSGALWSLSCPAGACGAQTSVAVSTTGISAGLGSDADDDLLANDQVNITADTFELPNPAPATFPLIGGPVGMAINKLDHHWFIADAANNQAVEYLYPGGALVGTVPGNTGGLPIGVAVDPGHTLK